MYIRKKIKFRVALFLLLVFVIVYWRGANYFIKKQNLSCSYHFVYAMCKSKTVAIPSFWQVLQQGIKF